jgi:DNA-binding transcriptional MerR regulator
MRIGDFARLGNVSVRALRFYDGTGLLRALHVDPDSGYRHYGPGQISRLHQIRAFQDLAFSLAEIRELLRRDLSRGGLRELMEQRRSELKRHIREDVARLARIEVRLQDLTERRGVRSPDRLGISLGQRRYSVSVIPTVEQMAGIQRFSSARSKA